MSSACALRNVTVAFGDVVVLEDVRLDVAGGSCVVVLGVNGCGKSTLVKAMVGLVAPVRGTVHLLGVDVRSMRTWGRVAYAPQHVPDLHGIPISVSEFVASGLVGAGPLPRGKGTVDAALRGMGLWHVRRRPMDELSGGQQRRALLARTFVRDSAFAVLDEPTAGVDTQGRDHVIESVRRRKDQGQTTVVVTHTRDALFNLADRFIVVQPPPKPSIGFDGSAPPETLFTVRHDEDLPAPATGRRIG